MGRTLRGSVRYSAFLDVLLQYISFKLGNVNRQLPFLTYMSSSIRDIILSSLVGKISVLVFSVYALIWAIVEPLGLVP